MKNICIAIALVVSFAFAAKAQQNATVATSKQQQHVIKTDEKPAANYVDPVKQNQQQRSCCQKGSCGGHGGDGKTCVHDSHEKKDEQKGH
jgi:hypothetical protein